MIFRIFKNRKSSVDSVTYRGEVEISVMRNEHHIDTIEFKNTTLRVGRRQLAAALGGNLLSQFYQCSVRSMLWGIGGIDAFGVRISVPDTITTFLGGASNILATTTVDANMALGDDPCVTFHGALGYNSPVNGNRVTQIGLQMESGDIWAIATWNGFDKDSQTAFLVNWKVWFL